MGFYFGGGFDLMFTLVFCLVFGLIVFRIVQGIATWNKNNHSPRLTVEAIITGKRQEVHHHHSADNTAMHTSTSHYVTFQVESGDRMELYVPGSEYGLLAEGDRGRLTFQGTRYLGFERL